jgi:ABC-2 type transport system permease protein
MLLLSAGLLALALRLEARRDLGAGLVADRAGHDSAPTRYATPLGLGLRLQRGPIIGWTLTIVLSALMFGSVVEAMNDLMADAGGSVADMLRGTGIDALLSLLVSMIAIITAVFAIQTSVSLRGDEATSILEPQLAGALSRTRWALGRLLIPLVGSAALLLLGGACMGAGYGSLVGDSGQAGRLALAALAYWPAVMVLVGISVALFGWIPRLAIPLTWGVLAAMWFVLIIGDALHLPDWLLELLPFSATPYQPLQPLRWTPLVVMTAVAATLIWTGLHRFTRRDVKPG